MIRISPTAASIPFNPQESRLTASNLNDVVLETNDLIIAEESARALADTAVYDSAKLYVDTQLSTMPTSVYIDGGPAPEAYFDSNYIIDGGSAT
jgi:hypothetical protein